MPDARFHDGRTGAAHAVTPFVFGRELRIVDELGSTLATWKLDAVTTEPEVDPDGMVALTARDQPGRLLTADPAILEAARRAGVHVPRPSIWRRRHWIGVSAGVAASLALGVLALNAMPRWLASVIPHAWEEKLGEPVEALMAASSGRCTGAEGQAALDRLVERLRAAGGIGMRVRLSVLDDPLVNAFTLPGGRVLVMRGLISASDDGAVLAGVIAHELGHVTHRDSTTMLLRGMGLSLLLSSIGLGDGGGAALNGAGHLTALAYGRAAEASADDTAIALLTAAGLRPDGLSRFFAHLEGGHASHTPGATAGNDTAGKNRAGKDRARQDGDAPDPPRRVEPRGGAAGNWLSTHPPSTERRIRTARPATGEMPFTETEWRAIQAMCGVKPRRTGEPRSGVAE